MGSAIDSLILSAVFGIDPEMPFRSFRHRFMLDQCAEDTPVSEQAACAKDDDYDPDDCFCFHENTSFEIYTRRTASDRQQYAE